MSPFWKSLCCVFLCRTPTSSSAVCWTSWGLCPSTCAQQQSTWASGTPALSTLTSPSRCWAPGPARGTNTQPQTAVVENLSARMCCSEICSRVLISVCLFVLQMWSAIREAGGLHEPVPGPGAWRLSEPVSAGVPESKWHICSLTHSLVSHEEI